MTELFYITYEYIKNIEFNFIFHNILKMIQNLWLDIKAHNLPAMDIENDKLIN